MSFNPPHGVRYDRLEQENVITVSDCDEQQVKNNDLNINILNTNKLISESKDKLILKREEYDAKLKDNSISKEERIFYLTQKQEINKLLKDLNKCQRQLNKARMKETSVKKEVKEVVTEITDPLTKPLNIASASSMLGSCLSICSGILLEKNNFNLDIAASIGISGIILFFGSACMLSYKTYHEEEFKKKYEY